MNTENKVHEAAKKMKAARDEHQRLLVEVGKAWNAFKETEAAFFDSLSATEAPPNVLLGDTLIFPEEEWFDMNEGHRVRFVTVQVAA